MMNTAIKTIAITVLGLLVSAPMAVWVDAAQVAQNYLIATRYDESGRVLGTISPKPSSNLPHLATRNTYNINTGLLDKIESGTLATFQDENTLPNNWSGFTVTSSEQYLYDSAGRKAIVIQLDSTNAIIAVTQTSYDAYDRPQCIARRMDKSTFATVNVNQDACSLINASTADPDRITKYTYDSLDSVVQEDRGLKTVDAQIYVRNTYKSGTALLETQIDANNNKTTLYYDTNARLQRMEYPVATSGALQSSTTDYVQFGYDANGNKTSERKRSGETITYAYDANNRMTMKDYTNNATVNDVCYLYDNRGLQTEARFNNTQDPVSCMAAVGLSNRYDGVGNILTATTTQSGPALQLQYDYDLNNNRTSIMHPDSVTFRYSFDQLNRVTGASDKSTADNSLLAVSYYDYGKRSGLTRNGSQGATTSFTFLNKVQLSAFTQTLGTTANSLTNSFAYNAAGQVTQLTEGNTSYTYVGSNDREGNYIADGLNRYTSVAGQPFGYDSRGNLTNDGRYIYTYDTENRLLTVTGANVNLAFVYDPNGRLFRYTSTDGAKHQYLYDNNALVIEYLNGNMDKRYVHGDQVDEPWIMYTGSAVGSANISYLHANHQGSIIAYTNATGQVTNKLAYDAYGIPASLNVGTFGYTGQIYLKEVGLYYYKARIYHPQLGRFLQTDPIGYKDDMDLYSYVGDDPVNRTDPSGLYGVGEAQAMAEAHMFFRDPENREGLKREIIAFWDAITTGDTAKLETAAVAAAVVVAQAKTHGNSKANTNVHHRYVIKDAKTGDVLKTGISGRPLNSDGSSPRANSQVNAINKTAAEGEKVKAAVEETGIPGRAAALEAEKAATVDLKAADNSLKLQCRPDPNKVGGCL